MVRTQGAPRAITAAPLRTVRPKLLREVYANPEKELLRLSRAGRVVRIAPGTYTAKPDSVAPEAQWRPGFEEAAMAYACAAYGHRVPVLYGIGAARFHHAIPRAIGTTVVAVPTSHRPTAMDDGGTVTFTTTDVDRLEARFERGELGRFLVTTPEQTLLDLLDRPSLGGAPEEASVAVEALGELVDLGHVRGLAARRTQALRSKLDHYLARRGDPR